MKGLSNYLCRRRYEELRKSGAAGLAIAKLERWLLDTETGDRSELQDVPEGLAVTDQTIEAVKVGAVRYAGSVAKLLG